MSGFFSAQLDFEKQTKEGQCRQTGDCLDADTLLYPWEDSGYFAEQCLAPNCGRWRSLELPAHLAEAAHLAIRLDNLKEGGARFSYPETLTPYEWTVIEALQITRRKANSDNREDQAKQIQEQQRIAEFEAWGNRASGR